MADKSAAELFDMKVAHVGLNAANDGEAAGVAGDFRIVTPADELDPLSQVLRMMSAESRAELFKGEFGEIYSQYEMLQNILGTGGVQAIMPYDVRMR